MSKIPVWLFFMLVTTLTQSLRIHMYEMYYTSLNKIPEGEGRTDIERRAYAMSHLLFVERFAIDGIIFGLFTILGHATQLVDF